MRGAADGLLVEPIHSRNSTGALVMKATDVGFAGSIPALYERHLGRLLFEPYALDLAARMADLRQGRLLEVAAGTGIVTRALAGALPGTVEIVATDLNQAMVDFAMAQPIARDPVWRQADGLRLPFEDQSFDAVLCQFGVMFFPDKRAGYAEARRVLKPGGRFVFNVWGRIEENDFARIVTEAAAAVFPDDPPRFLARTPYGYYDTDVIESDLRGAGFSNVMVETVELRSRAASHRDPAVGLCQGTPLRGEIEALAADRLDEVTDAAANALSSRFGRGPVDGKMQAHVVTAIP